MAPKDILKTLDAGCQVAVVTMTGSCCPVTRAHIQAFLEARRLLMDDFNFGCVLGALSLNPDRYVDNKLAKKGLPSISKRDRMHLVELAVQEHSWIEYSGYRETEYFEWYNKKWGHLRFVHYLLNGADDVLRRKKWTWSDTLQVVMCRPESTGELLSELHKANVNTSDGTFIVGPELEDISSTEVRNALFQGDQTRLMKMLHPEVARWCWMKGPYRPPSDSVWCEEAPAVDQPPDAGSETPAAETPEARLQAARQIFTFVFGVLNNAVDEGGVTDCTGALAALSVSTVTFAGACDALAGAIEESLISQKDKSTLAGFVHALSTHGVPDSAKLPQLLFGVPGTVCEVGEANSETAVSHPGSERATAFKRWQRSAKASSAGKAAEGGPTSGISLHDIKQLCTVGTAGENLERSQATLSGHGPKAKRAAMALETLDILASGAYTSAFSYEIVDISDSLCRAVAASMHVPAGMWTSPALPAGKQKLSVEVNCCTVLAAAQTLAQSKAATATPGVLNFASARNPGGGFTTGAEAQEESLARSSALYPCLSKHFDAFFVPNRQAASGLYTHDLIHSPDVPVLRDESGLLLDAPYLVDFVTCAAPNFGVLQQRERDAARQCSEALHERIRRVLRTFASNGCVDLVLGAWGCGVFGNDPGTVSRLFRQALTEFPCFRRVIFAVLDPGMAEIFGNEFQVCVEGLPGKASRGKGEGSVQVQNSRMPTDGKRRGMPKR